MFLFCLFLCILGRKNLTIKCSTQNGWKSTRILTWVNTGKKHEWYVRRMDIGNSEHCNVQFQKIFILSQQKGLEFPGGWGDSVRPSVWSLIGISRGVGILHYRKQSPNAAVLQYRAETWCLTQTTCTFRYITCKLFRANNNSEFANKR